jgi:hypothetical protein
MPTEVVAELSVCAAGFVEIGGKLVRSGGRPLRVEKEVVGVYHVIFDEALPAIPVVVATSDGGPQGSFAEIRKETITPNGFKVEGRDYDTHGLADVGFNFLVVNVA